MKPFVSLLTDDAEMHPDRSLGVALAHCMMLTPITNQDRHGLFAKVYRDSTPAVQLECRAEMQAMRDARRGETEARVAWPAKPPVIADNVVSLS